MQGVDDAKGLPDWGDIFASYEDSWDKLCVHFAGYFWCLQSCDSIALYLCTKILHCQCNTT